MAEFTDREQEEIDRANESGLRPVVFVHGLWLLSSSWDRWRAFFEDQGYITLAPGWPDDPETVEAAKADPEVFANKMITQVTDHYLAAIAQLTIDPAVVGHSFGGLIAQRIAGEGVAAVTVAIDSAPFRGVLLLPASSLKSAAPVLTHPASVGKSVSLTFEQFSFGWSNALTEEEGRQLYDEYHVPAARNPLFQAATANLNPFTQAKVDTGNHERGPLLIISGDEDNTAGPAIQHAIFALQEKNPAVTQLVDIPGRGHSLTIDHGWKEVAEIAIGFVREHE
ncbi:pimeloyl-ACP methyl ester carboxylesterase [Conyzicola lurida]|uniref:Pimeloyl-ACP methyl ester carboxylesterase n=1 Tax=Conyzicola lurida TaxID=1172621 RepID=A0A841APV2_9MICO|nr:alpha/beta hydrolase [Conyzicola lurida]MBB5843623.1 pimeloyl-ACP methyl ester carboxylesterase [Conyzicola lurida]